MIAEHQKQSPKAMARPPQSTMLNVPNAPRAQYYIRSVKEAVLEDNASISGTYAYCIDAFERYLAVYSMEYRHLTRFILEYTEVNTISRYTGANPDNIPRISIYIMPDIRKQLLRIANDHLLHLSNIPIFEDRTKRPKLTLYATLALGWTVFQLGYSIPLCDGDDPYNSDIPQFLKRHKRR